MTTAPTVYTQFGYTLALAERSLTAVLQDHLAERGVRPETWYALQLLTVRGPVLERELLAADLASSRALNPDSTRALLARLEAEGLIRVDHEIELTDDGRALHRSLREYVAIPRDRLLSQFDVEHRDHRAYAAGNRRGRRRLTRVTRPGARPGCPTPTAGPSRTGPARRRKRGRRSALASAARLPGPLDPPAARVLDALIGAARA